MVSAVALPGLPEVREGADLAALIAGAADTPELGGLRDGDLISVAHKVISKAEGRVRRLVDVVAGEQARELAAQLGKEPRHVQVVLDEAAEILRAERGVLITLTHHGFVCANAGVDTSNAAAADTLVLLPRDPDASARALRERLEARCGVRPGVLISDSFGRAWRHGQVDVAIGCAGLRPLDDWRGRQDARGLTLRATWLAVADAVAATADLARSKDSYDPVVVVRGLERHVCEEDGPGARVLLRDGAEDLFR